MFIRHHVRVYAQWPCRCCACPQARNPGRKDSFCMRPPSPQVQLNVLVIHMSLPSNCRTRNLISAAVFSGVLYCCMLIELCAWYLQPQLVDLFKQWQCWALRVPWPPGVVAQPFQSTTTTIATTSINTITTSINISITTITTSAITAY